MASKVKSRIGEPLKTYQEEAIKKILSNNGSALICHPMGSGKTRTSIEAVEELKRRGQAKVAIAVVPATLRTNFVDNGVKMWSKAKGQILGSLSEDYPDIYDNSIPRADYYVVSYDMFKKDPYLYVDRTKADTIVVDEMHNFRNDNTKNYEQMKNVRKHVKNFIGLTGTPFNNTPADVRPLVDIVSSGNHDLGHTKKQFEMQFITNGKDGKPDGLKNTARLSAALNKWIHYASMSDIQNDASVPKKVVQEVNVEMSPEQKRYYDFVMRKVPKDVREKIRLGMPVNRKEAFSILPMLTQARAVSNSIGYLSDRIPDHVAAESTPKIRQVLKDTEQHLRENPHGQVIIHSHLVEAGTNPISAGLAAKKIPFRVLTGQVKGADRDKAVSDYNKGKAKVIVISSAGTTGLNLPNTTMHMALDGHYNPAVIDQIEARGIRQGGQSYIPDPSKRKVIVRRYKSVMPPTLLNKWGITNRDHSVDEWIYNLASNKNDINTSAEALLKKTSSYQNMYTNDTILDILLYKCATDLDAHQNIF